LPFNLVETNGRGIQVCKIAFLDDIGSGSTSTKERGQIKGARWGGYPEMVDAKSSASSCDPIQGFVKQERVHDIQSGKKK
jgi:hypothetical protein